MKVVGIDNVLDTKVVIWKKHPSSSKYWKAKMDDRVIFLRMNNFPVEPLYSLITSSEIRDFDDLPRGWVLE